LSSGSLAKTARQIGHGLTEGIFGSAVGLVGSRRPAWAGAA
jgi:hypothetical protein